MNKFIHHSTVVYLALVILLRMMAMPVSLMDYSLNKGFIAENLCENRGRPDMHCGGSCFLHKQLTKANENSESRNQKTGTKIVMVDFFESMPRHNFHTDAVSRAFAHPKGITSFADPFSGNIFHPPMA